ncbi:MAG TPA: hypothetical protein VFY15_03260, partial [Acidimicrobiia bacterium]|nr:hypothetical protein [Acidimicrobiia bacterium]
MDLIAPGLAALAGVGAWLLVVIQRRATRRLAEHRDALRSDLEAAHAAAAAERRRLQVLLPEAAEAAWAARALARDAARHRDALAAQAASSRLREVDQATRAEELAAKVRGLAAALDQASRSADIASARIVSLETDLARLVADAERNRAGTESAVAAARAEAAESARHAAEVRRQLADATAALEEAHRRNLVLGHEATAAAGRQRALEEELERAAAALQQSRRDADSGRVEALRLAAELDRVRHDADLRVAAALASIPSAPAPPPAPQPDARLVAQQAEIRDLEDRLATLAAARNAEARRLGERIASLERLHLEIGARDERIEALESELKDSTGALESLRLEASQLDTRLRSAVRRLEEAHRRNLVLGHEATAAAGRQRALEEQLEHAAAALQQSRRDADSGRAEALRLSAELDRVRHDADLRVAAALASIPSLPTPSPAPQPDARLVAQQAEIRDLEDRLATLAAARNAEAFRLGERITSLERL